MIVRPSRALFGALASAVAGAVVWLLALKVGAVGRLDSAMLEEFAGVGGVRTRHLAGLVVKFADPLPFAVLSAALCIAALVRCTKRRALAAALVLAGATLTAQILKVPLASPRPADGPPGISIVDTAWPSGHATAAMSLALCLVLVCTPRWRPLAAAVGSVFSVSIAYGLQILGWHYPSDVIGAYFVAGAWFGIGVAVLRAGERNAVGTDQGLWTAIAPTMLTGLAAAGLTAATLVLDPLSWFTHEESVFSFLGSVAAIGAAGLAVAAAAAATLRRVR